MPGYVSLNRIGSRRYLHTATGIKIEWLKTEGEAGYWQLTDRDGTNWLTNVPTLREARQYISGRVQR